MSDEIIQNLKSKMEKTVENLREEFLKIRGNRASVSLVDEIKVDYYGTVTPLKQMATLSTPEPRQITVTPWDKSAIPLIEKAIQQSDLGLSPANDGNMIRLNLPALTEDRRKELVKVAKKIAEDSRVSVRHIRREANDAIKAKTKDKEITEDDEKRLLKSVQSSTDDVISKIDAMLDSKEKDILEV